VQAEGFEEAECSEGGVREAVRGVAIVGGMQIKAAEICGVRDKIKKVVERSGPLQYVAAAKNEEYSKRHNNGHADGKVRAQGGAKRSILIPWTCGSRKVALHSSWHLHYQGL
jgi:hypothetical protein